MIVCAAYFTEEGKKTGKRLEEALASAGPGQARAGMRFYFHWREEGTSLHEFAGTAFRYHLPVLFVGAAGIAVRTIAPFVQDKTTDSAVLVMDDRGQYVIPILSGHLGGANDLAGAFAAAAGARPVITTASDVHGCFAADVFARRNGLAVRNREGIRLVADRALEGRRMRIAVDPQIRVMTETVPEGIEVSRDLKGQAEILTSSKEPASTGNHVTGSFSCCEECAPSCLLWLSPKEYVIGMGCRRGRTFEELNAFLLDCIQRSDVMEKEPAGSAEEWIRLHVRAFATIDRKADETGLQILAQYWHVPLLTYAAEELCDIPDRFCFAESDFVRNVTGVSNVCERAAVMGAAGSNTGIAGAGFRTADGGMDVFSAVRFAIRKQSGEGMTLAMAKGAPFIQTFDTGVMGRGSMEDRDRHGE